MLYRMVICVTNCKVTNYYLILQYLLLLFASVLSHFLYFLPVFYFFILFDTTLSSLGRFIFDSIYYNVFLKLIVYEFHTFRSPVLQT